MKTPSSEASPARLGAIALALMAGAALATGYVVHTQLPVNAVELPFEASVREPIRVVLPQGWAFFTRSPREADVIALVRGADGQWRDGQRSPHAEPRNVFGFARASRAQGVEIGMLAGGLGSQGWVQCRVSPAQCLQALTAVPMPNAAKLPTLCGDIGLVRQTPLPWAWSRAREHMVMPSTVARLVVSC